MTRIIALCLTLGLALGSVVLPQIASADNEREDDEDHGNDDRDRSYNRCSCARSDEEGHGERTRERNRNHRKGDRVTRDDFYYFDDYANLPRLPRGQRYAVVDGNIVALDTRTYEILNLIRALQAITN
jgi:Ni/Co efflux regulator RcnB